MAGRGDTLLCHALDAPVRVVELLGELPAIGIELPGWACLDSFQTSLHTSLFDSKGNRMKVEIGAYEAKTRLPELLRQVKAGKRFTITNRGEAVADLVPSRGAKPRDKLAAVEKFRTYLRENPVRGVASIRRLIEEGRA